MELNEKINSTPDLILKLLDRAGWNYKKTGNRYMGACPVCNRGFRTPNTVFNVDTNSFKCFSCEGSGGLKDLAEHLNVDFKEFLKEEGIIEDDENIPKKDKEYQALERDKMINEGVTTKEKNKEKILQIDLDKISTQVIDQEVKDYLLSRYIDPEVVKDYIRIIRPKQDEAFKYLEDYYKDGYKLIIPSMDPEGNLKGLKIRNVKGKEPKVKNLKGLKLYSIGIDKLKDNTNDYCIIVEGEIDYLTGIYLSPADSFIALPSSHYTLTAEEKAYLPEKVILLLDNDEAGRTATERIAIDLKKEGRKVYIGKYPSYAKDLNELLAYHKGNIDNALEDFQNIIYEAVQNPFTLTKTLRETGEKLINRLEERLKEAEEKGLEKPEPLALKTGLDFLDELLDGGLRRGLYAIAGQPAIGKTSFVLALAKHLAEQEKKSLIISLEMTDEDLLIQLLSWLTEIPKRKILDEAVDRYELEEIKEALNNSIFNNIFIDTEAKTIEDIENKVIDTLNDVDNENLVVFIDYLQQIKPSRDFLKSEYRLQAKDIAYKLKEIANKYNLPVFVISSTQRDGYKGTNEDGNKKKKGNSEPNYIAMFKESGDIEYSLYAGYFLDYPKQEEISFYQKEKYELPIKIVKVKSRFGSVRDEEHKNIYKIAVLNFKTGELKDLIPY